MTPATVLEHTLHEEIPISVAMGVRVAGYDGTSLHLAAPLAPNINHKSTAFGGSLYTLTVLCGWGLLHTKLAEIGLDKKIVIQDGNIRYLLPVDGDMQAECRLDEAAFGRFLQTLKKHGRARLAMNASVHQNGQVAVTFTGNFVAHG